MLFDTSYGLKLVKVCCFGGILLYFTLLYSTLRCANRGYYLFYSTVFDSTLLVYMSWTCITASVHVVDVYGSL